MLDNFQKKLRPINLGSLVVETPVLLCPLAGITDVPYRAAVHFFGSNLMYSEMISSVAMTKNSLKTIRMTTLQNSGANIGIQLAGSDVDTMVQAAKMSVDSGACLIDINMGCPAKKVVRGIAGAALMREEIMAARIMEALVKAVDVPVSMKMRLGWDCDNINSPRLAKIAQESGISMITVHGRTRSQFFSGEADWRAIAKVKQEVRIPVIANGDIKTPEDALQALEQSQADGVMIGRGTYGRPWIIEHISHFLNTGIALQEPSLENKFSITMDHYNMLLDYYGVENGIKIARKHLSNYTKGLRNSAVLRAKLNISENKEEIVDLITKCFEMEIDHNKYGVSL